MEEASKGVKEAAYKLRQNAERERIAAEKRQQGETAGESEGATGVNPIKETNPVTNPPGKSTGAIPKQKGEGSKVIKQEGKDTNPTNPLTGATETPEGPNKINNPAGPPSDNSGNPSYSSYSPWKMRRL